MSYNETTFETNGRNNSRRLSFWNLNCGLMPAFRGNFFPAALVSFWCLLGVIAPAVTQAQTAPNLDANGWTIITPSADTRKVYVSSSVGNDSNNGLSENTPVKTLQKGKSLLRGGFPDWLLLKKGDTWTNEGFGWAPSGRSAAEPAVISSYGSGGRPLLKTNNTPNILGSWGSSPTLNLAVIGLEFYEYTRDPSNPSYNPAAANLGRPIG